MKILLHTCCAPCLAASLPVFAADGDLLVWFRNPNVHPFVEFSKRLRAVELLAEREHVPCELVREYGLRSFLEMIPPATPDRCRLCYAERLSRAARRAAEVRADAFSTTLLASVRQNHDAVRAAGDQAEGETGVPFIYKDLRSRAADGLARVKALSLYRQQYCGCIYSEYDRFGPSSGENPSATT